MISRKNIKPTSEVDYYSFIEKISPGRSPSIYHREHSYYWTDFPSPPIFSIYNTTFQKVTPQPNCVDCSRFGEIHFWARTGTPYCPTLVVISFSPHYEVKKIRYFFYKGLEISLPDGSFGRITAPDKELFDYCLSGFLKHYLSDKYSFRAYC